MNYRRLMLDKGALEEAIIDEIYDHIKLPPGEQGEFMIGAIERAAHDVAVSGAPQEMLGFILTGETAQFCEGCKDAGCCVKCDPIGLEYDSVKKMAKELQMSAKAVIKTYLIRHPQDDKETYALKHTKPCGFLKEGRCTIYNGRPFSCFLFPLYAEEQPPDKHGHSQPPKLGIGGHSYCQFGFKMLSWYALAIVYKEVMQKFYPDMAKAQEALAEQVYPNREEFDKMNQMEQIMSMHKSNKKFAEISKKVGISGRHG